MAGLSGWRFRVFKVASDRPALSTRPDAELVNTMLDNAVETLNSGERPVIHSDRCRHYRWPGWLKE